MSFEPTFRSTLQRGHALVSTLGADTATTEASGTAEGCCTCFSSVLSSFVLSVIGDFVSPVGGTFCEVTDPFREAGGVGVVLTEVWETTDALRDVGGVVVFADISEAVEVLREVGGGVEDSS